VFPETWFNFEIDALYLTIEYDPDPDFLNPCLVREGFITGMNKVRNLAIFGENEMCRKYCFSDGYEKWVGDMLYFFKNVHNLTFVYDHHRHENKGGDIASLGFEDLKESSGYYFEDDPAFIYHPAVNHILFAPDQDDWSNWHPVDKLALKSYQYDELRLG